MNLAEPPAQPSQQDVEALPAPTREGSDTGPLAQFGTAEEEVSRILGLQHNYYGVLKVTKENKAHEIRANWKQLDSILHPDTSSTPQVAEASLMVNRASHTLRSSMKKAVYDLYIGYLSKHAEKSGVSDSGLEATPISIPKWLDLYFRIPGTGCCVTLLLSPITLLILLLCFVVFLILLPVGCVTCICSCCTAMFEKEPEAEGTLEQQADLEKA